MKPAGQMTLTLTKELEEFVRAEVRKGGFASSSEYVRALVRERFVRERDLSSRSRRLADALARSIADAESGRIQPADKAFAKLREKLRSERNDTR